MMVGSFPVWHTLSQARTVQLIRCWSIISTRRFTCCVKDYNERTKPNHSSNQNLNSTSCPLASNRERKGTLYVHWPYCAQICTYCNFNKYIRTSLDYERHYTCFVKEFQSFLTKSSISTFTSVYFGGGTPSLAGPRLVEMILEAVQKYSNLCDNTEVCLEANPSSAQSSKLMEFKRAGVNRLSLGIQSLNDNDLRLMNRDHSSEEGARALENAISVFPGRVNTDIIFGRPGQSVVSWTEELERVAQMIDNHLSLYQLTIEQGTPLATAVKKKELTMPGSDCTAEMYEIAVKILDGAGLQRYEISNFAKQGFESQHNLSYWNGADYIGIGPGAHSRYLSADSLAFSDDPDVTYIHTVNTPEPNAWMNKVMSTESGVGLMKQLSRFQRMEEVMVTCLRTREGLSNEIWNQFSPESFAAHVQKLDSADKNGFSSLIHSGLLALDDRGLRATAKGLIVLDSLLPECILLLERFIIST